MVCHSLQGCEYASPVKEMKNLTVLSWVHDDRSTRPPVSLRSLVIWAGVDESVVALNGQPVNAFLENVTVTFFIWPLACVLEADPATAIVLGNGTLESLNSSTPPHTAHPFMTNYPKNQMESNWVPLLDALSASQGFDMIMETGNTWLETTMRSLLVERPDLRTLEDNLASISSLAYAPCSSRGGGVDMLRGDPTLARTWSPQNATVAGEHPVLKMHLQVNGIPLLVGSLSVLVLCAISAICVIGHDVNGQHSAGWRRY